MESPLHHPPPPSSSARPLDLEVTVVSAKHLKNVNWRNGDLKPYVVAYLDSDRRAATKPDDAGSIRPVWNERLALPLPLPLPLPSAETLLFLTLDVFHSKPSETPKPLVGTARSPLKGLLDVETFAAYASGGGSGSGTSPIRTLELRRPSGRPQGKIRIKVALRERASPPPEPDTTHHFPPPPPSGYFYSSDAPPFPSPSPPHTQHHSGRDYRTFSPPPSSLPPYGHPPPPPQSHSYPSQYPYGSYSDSYPSGYYSPASAAYYSAPPDPAPAPAPSPAHQYYDRASGYGGPSAPEGCSTGYSSYDNKPKGGRAGLATGIAVGAVAGALGGMALEEGLKHEEEKIAERVENDFSARDDYSDYRADY